ncbi:hypothetical protein D3C81_1807350 [compost metagenome]
MPLPIRARAKSGISGCDSMAAGHSGAAASLTAPPSRDGSARVAWATAACGASRWAMFMSTMSTRYSPASLRYLLPTLPVMVSTSPAQLCARMLKFIDLISASGPDQSVSRRLNRPATCGVAAKASRVPTDCA